MKKLKKFLTRLGGFLRENARSLIYMGAAIALEIAGLATAKHLLTSSEPQEFLASLLLVALPGVVLTVFVPGLRDSSRRLRTLAFVCVTLGVALGLIVISAMFYSGSDLDATIGVGLIGILITAVVAYVDWSPPKSAAETSAPRKRH